MAKRKKKIAAEDPPAAGAGWIMTYADLMSLLMAFFVMLLASAELDKKKFEELGKSMRLALGSPVTEFTQSVSDDFKVFHEQFKKEQTEFKEKMDQTKKDAAKLAEILQDHQQEVEIITHGRIIIIRLHAAGVFASGKAEIKTDFWPTIQKIKNELKSIKGDIIVSGYTDNIPIDNDQYRSNWELSAARAFSVIAYLMGAQNLPPDRFVLRGFGETRATVANDTAENRAKNRRVEILIDQRDPADKADENNKENIVDGPTQDPPLPKDLDNVKT